VNTRSVKFRLVVWYAGFLAICFLLLGAAAHVALKGYLVNSLISSQVRRARQVAILLSEKQQRGGVGQVGAEVEARYAPSLNERFVRISKPGGQIIYDSGATGDTKAFAAVPPPPGWPARVESSWRAPLANGREILVAAQVVGVQGSDQYLVEAGAPMDDVYDALRKWLIFLVAGLPIVASVAAGGGYFLVKRALMPVDQIASSAERISSHNLRERLPVAPTRDELERLSIALNHMIDRLEHALEHSRQFVADASHELRTPLTALRGELESLTQETQRTDAWRDRLGSALEEVDRLAQIVEGLFSISRLDAGEAAAEWVTFDLAKLTSSTADQMALLAEDKNIRVTCNGSQEVWIQGDRARLKQVIVNLMDNAIKYTHNGGSVTLSASTENGKAVLEVSDTGIGIPPEALPRVFERFYRVDKARSREQGGAGLGLAIVKSICTAHQGRVEASNRPDRGTRFRVELPLASAPRNNHKPQNSHEH
jgi:heavy metal sensor kinase